MSSLPNTLRARLETWLHDVPGDILRTPPVNLEEISEHWGVKKVIRRELDVAGLLYRLEEGGSIIFLRESDSPSRQRFSWAHELAHIVVSNSDLPEVSCRRAGKVDKKVEDYCDAIAAEILMPQRDFRTSADQLGWGLKSVHELAMRFNVSMDSAAIRMKDLNAEPVLMSMWRVGKGPLNALSRMWARPNQLAERFKPSVNWKSGPDAMFPLYEALTARECTSGSSRVLMKPREDSKSKSYSWVTTEGFGIGRGKTRRVIGFHYLARKP